jgi:hypothetical protein
MTATWLTTWPFAIGMMMWSPEARSGYEMTSTASVRITPPASPKR